MWATIWKLFCRGSTLIVFLTSFVYYFAQSTYDTVWIQMDCIHSYFYALSVQIPVWVWPVIADLWCWELIRGTGELFVRSLVPASIYHLYLYLFLETKMYYQIHIDLDSLYTYHTMLFNLVVFHADISNLWLLWPNFILKDSYLLYFFRFRISYSLRLFGLPIKVRSGKVSSWPQILGRDIKFELRLLFFSILFYLFLIIFIWPMGWSSPPRLSLSCYVYLDWAKTPWFKWDSKIIAQQINCINPQTS